MSTHTIHSVHKEKVVQGHLIAELAAHEGYELRDAKVHYDRALALDRAVVLRFVQETQSDAWEKLTQHYTASAEDTFFKQLEKALKDRGVDCH